MPTPTTPLSLRRRFWLATIDLLSRLGRNELRTLIVLALAAGGIWAFAEIADEVTEGDTHRFDRSILLAMRNANDLNDPWGPRWIEEMARDVTGLGGIAVLGGLTLFVCGFLWLEGKRRAMVLTALAILSGIALSFALKGTFDRPRPDLVPHHSHVSTSSFPSGHSMMAAVTYLTLGSLLARFHASTLVKAYFLVVAVVITIGVGVSRVYVGVHWPTDVLAGWSVGTAWALLCWVLARALQRRGAVEKNTARDAQSLPAQTAD